MIGQISRRRALLALATAAMAGGARAEGLARSLVPPLRPDAGDVPAPPTPGELVAAAGLSGHTGFAVVDMRSGEALEAFGAARALPPASVVKTVTALYALAHLGPGHRFRTRLMSKGTLKNGILRGDLWLVGGGDPTLDAGDLMSLARMLKQAGVREVRGRFVASSGGMPGSEQIDPAQPAHVGYNPAVSGLSLNFNRVRFEWKRSGGAYSATMDARAGGVSPAVQGIAMRIVARAMPVYAYGGGKGASGPREQWSVARGALGNGGSRWLPVRQPEAYAAEVFATLARSHGIVLPTALRETAVPAGAKTIAVIQSAPLTDILRGMLKYSTNLTAEMLGLAASAASAGAPPASLRASARMMSAWSAQTLGMRDAALVDHSGLGGASRLGPLSLAQALAASQHSETLRPLLKPVYLRDARGRPLRDSRVVIGAKTGTLNFVSGLGGFLTTAGGRDLTFAIISADPTRREALPVDQRERPPGGRNWSGRARKLQRQLLHRWSLMFDA